MGDIDRSNLHWMHSAKKKLEGVNWAYPSSQSVEEAERVSGPKPYGMSGPWGAWGKMACGWATEYTSGTPWRAGTLPGDVVNGGFPFFKLFDTYDGGDQGYTHADVLRLTAPDRIPYTYDSLEHLYYAIPEHQYSESGLHHF